MRTPRAIYSMEHDQKVEHHFTICCQVEAEPSDDVLTKLTSSFLIDASALAFCRFSHAVIFASSLLDLRKLHRVVRVLIKIKVIEVSQPHFQECPGTTYIAEF